MEVVRAHEKMCAHAPKKACVGVLGALRTSGGWPKQPRWPAEQHGGAAPWHPRDSERGQSQRGHRRGRNVAVGEPRGGHEGGGAADLPHSVAVVVHEIVPVVGADRDSGARGEGDAAVAEQVAGCAAVHGDIDVRWDRRT